MHSTLRVAACAVVLAGCRADERGPAASTGSATATAATAAGEVAAPAMAVTQASWAPDALEELVAPIALYPDQLLGQILAASVNAQEVLDAGNWLLEHESLKGEPLDAAARKVGFGPAVRALVRFPTVIDMMCQEIDWTRQLGSAFTSDQKSVLDAVQRLRAQAADVGNLKSTPQQTVERKTEGGKRVVEVKPANPQVVYVPQYDPQAVYTTPPPAPVATYPAVPVTPAAPAPNANTVDKGAAVAGGLLAFGVGVALGAALNDDDDYYPHWGSGVVFVGPRPFYPPAYVYRPVYGPAFHPAYRYAPPPSYRYRYNGGGNTNVVINNQNNYFTRFDNHQNLRAGAARSPLNQTAARGESWKGQSTYAGARRTANAGRDVDARERNVARAERGVANAERGVANAERGVANAERRTANVERRTATAQRANATAGAPRGVGAKIQTRPGAGQPDRVPARHDRGYGAPASQGGRDDAGPVRGQPERTAGASRPAARRAATPAPSPARPATQGGQREHALSGASRHDAGSFDRAASARGRASAGGGHAATARRPAGARRAS